MNNSNNIITKIDGCRARQKVPTIWRVYSSSASSRPVDVVGGRMTALLIYCYKPTELPNGHILPYLCCWATDKIRQMMNFNNQ